MDIFIGADQQLPLKMNTHKREYLLGLIKQRD